MLFSIQYLRAAAAMAVVAEHTNWTHSQLLQCGVDVFFVISGFIMLNVSQRETSPGQFMRARLLRIAPLYWILTLVTAASTHPPLGHLALSLAFWPHPNPDGNGVPVLEQGWTLTFEMFFYVLFAAVLALPRTVRMRALTAALLGLVALGLLARPGTWAAATYTSPLLLEFLGGAWLWVLWDRRRLPQGWAALALALAGAAALAAQFTLPVSATWRAIVWGVPSLLIVAGALGIERGNRLPRSRPLKWLGDSSYSLYLVQYLVLDAVTHAVKPLPAPLAVPAAVAITAAIGLAVYRAIERPANALAKRLLPRPPANAPRPTPARIA